MQFRLTDALENLMPGRALDLAAGQGRHALWLAGRGWKVTAVDREIAAIPGVDVIWADLERHEFKIEPEAWDLIVCWLYWQEDLMPLIAAGVRKGGVAALAGKTSGRFTTSLIRYRKFFEDWEELDSGEEDGRAWLIVRR
ncbi:MAG: hypothetical protein ABJC09_13675 [Terriglobia bacterium]